MIDDDIELHPWKKQLIFLSYFFGCSKARTRARDRCVEMILMRLCNVFYGIWSIYDQIEYIS